jgi:electron transport complex protein RnfB
MAVLNSQKLKGLLADIPEIPDKPRSKTRRPRRIAIVLEPNCTGCEVCIPFCPVECIEQDDAESYPLRPIPPVRIRYDECIGCEICVRVCEKLAWDALEMRPTEEVEQHAGITIHDRFPPAPEPR